jgi:hypothetical protein
MASNFNSSMSMLDPVHRSDRYAAETVSTKIESTDRTRRPAANSRGDRAQLGAGRHRAEARDHPAEVGAAVLSEVLARDSACHRDHVGVVADRLDGDVTAGQFLQRDPATTELGDLLGQELAPRCGHSRKDRRRLGASLGGLQALGPKPVLAGDVFEQRVLDAADVEGGRREGFEVDFQGRQPHVVKALAKARDRRRHARGNRALQRGDADKAGAHATPLVG